MQNRIQEAGYTLAEMLVVMALIGILAGTAVSNLKELNDPLADASFTVTHYLRLVRARGISQTLFIQVAPTSSTIIAASSSDSCSGTMTAIDDLEVNLPRGASMSDTSWTACFTPRGLSEDNITFDLSDSDGQSKTVEIALGGGVRIQ